MESITRYKPFLLIKEQIRLNKSMFGPTIALLSVPTLLLMKYFCYKFKHINSEIRGKYEKDQYKTMFVTHKNRLCSPHLNTRLICGPTCSYLYLKNIINLINDAKESLSLCMYHLSIDDVYHALLNAHNRGIHVRIITDAVMLSSTGNKITKLSHQEVATKIPKTKFGYMHHKFVIIDEDNITNRRVLYGSVNYTVNALINNWEFMLLTKSVSVIKRFTEEFNCLWNSDTFMYLVNVTSVIGTME